MEMRPRFAVGLLPLLAWGVIGCSADAEESGVPAGQGPSASRSFEYLKAVCRIGPRQSGSRGMLKQQNLIIRHFSELGAEVRLQPFDAEHPESGGPVRMTNIVVSWHPKARERVLICCHYDTRPFPDRDFLNPRGNFIGANDGASGVALLMELGHHMRAVRPAFSNSEKVVGVDFVFLDGEEFVFKKNADLKRYFLGSTHFSTAYRKQPPAYRYECGILVDMIGDKSLNIFMEKNSRRFARTVTGSIWNAARKVGVREFIAREKHEVSDDHLPLNKIAQIPTCDIIDFDYKYWHTTRDIPENCSGKSIAKVARVLLQWMTQIPHR